MYYLSYLCSVIFSPQCKLLIISITHCQYTCYMTLQCSEHVLMLNLKKFIVSLKVIIHSVKAYIGIPICQSTPYCTKVIL